MKKVNCPVWTIPPIAQYDVPEKIIVIYHSTPRYDAFLEEVSKIAKIVDASLFVTFPDEESNKKISLDSLKKKIDSAKVEILENIANEKDITNLSNSFTNGLLSVIDEDRSFWKKIFESSNVKKMIKQSQIPILVYPAKYFDH